MDFLGVSILALALLTPTVAFISFWEGGSTHDSITKKAILKKVKEICQPESDSSSVTPSAEELIQSCLNPDGKEDISAAKFYSALREILANNFLVDSQFLKSAAHHFHSETFLEGRKLIMQGMMDIKANIRQENFQAARETLGRVLHTLQDFYSHSNWVELGYTEPYINLIRPDLPLENLADEKTATCKDCASGTCQNQILPNILNEKILTSGYMDMFSSAKPPGKCSHGGTDDPTSRTVPRGGINKDERRPHNAAFHDAAVNLATDASLQLLEDIRSAARDQDFLRMIGIAHSSVVCFVVDTTGSMSDDIKEAISVAHEIIDSKIGTQDEPSEYILVPFNDPDFGPVIRTTDAETMKAEISKLGADGGGDEPEMCLSGLQLALTGAPPSSNIYVFTDATAKDIALKDTIFALIRSTKSSVSFFMTNVFTRRRRSASAASFQVYEDLAIASGGQAIQVSKAQLPQATDVILDTSTSALVTVIQRARKTELEETFLFMLDESLKNVTIYITGRSIAFTLTNPAGVSQNDNEAKGNLGTIQTVGNLRRIRLNSDVQSGTWQINIKSTKPYTFKVTGQSTITFIYDFVERFTGSHPGYAVLSGCPQAGQPVTLMLSVIGRKGSSSITIKEVSLVLVSSREAITNGTMTDMGNGDILVTVDKVPEGEFVVSLRGKNQGADSEFQRQSTTQMSVSKVKIQAVVDSSVEPGKTLQIPFSVMTQEAGGAYTINARNDRNFPMTFPNNLDLMTGQYSNATLTITPPAITESGTDITLTIKATSSSGADSNFIILRLSVVTKITDFSQPQCEVGSILADDCPKDLSHCGHFQWQLSANLTDGNGTGIESISLRQGSGSLLYTSLSAPHIEAHYNASCCSQIVEFVAVDKVGNVGKCYHSIKVSGAPLAAALPLWLCLLISIVVTRP